MGYESYVHGEIYVRPAIPEYLLKSLYMMPDNGASIGSYDTADLVGTSGGDEDTVGVVNGTIAVIPGESYTTVTCRYDERYKAYDLGEQVTNLAKALRQRGGYAVTGALYVQGEESLDLSRWYIDKDLDPVCEVPTIVWPNGDRGWG